MEVISLSHMPLVDTKESESELRIKLASPIQVSLTAAWVADQNLENLRSWNSRSEGSNVQNVQRSGLSGSSVFQTRTRSVIKIPVFGNSVDWQELRNTAYIARNLKDVESPLQVSLPPT